MKNLSTLPFIALCGAAIGFFALVSLNPLAQAGPGFQETAPQEAEPMGKEDAAKKDAAKAPAKELHNSMEALEKSMRSLRRLMTDPEQTKEALALCSEMETHILAGLQHVPAPHSELEDQTELEYQVGFKRRMLGVYNVVLDLEVALEKGDGDAAKAAFRSLGSERRDGHQVYISPEDQQRNRRGRGGRGGRGGPGGGERGGDRGGDKGSDKGGDDGGN